MSICSVSAIPTLVELEKTQYEEFLTYIGQIAIDIEGENITLNADFNSLIRLQTETIQSILQFQSLYQNNEYFRDVQLTKAFTMIGEGLKNINNTNIEILGAVRNSDTANQEILGQILTAITTLDAHQEERKSDWYDKFETIMNPISQTISDVSNTINIISNTVDAVYGIFEIFQDTQDVFIEQIAGDTAVIALNFIGGMRTVVAEAMAGSSMVCTDTALDECVYNPFGEGPIGCVGAELLACTLIPIPIETNSNDLSDKKDDQN